MKEYYKSRKGISLIELLLTLAIVSIVLLVIFNIFSISNRSYTISSGKGFGQQDGRIAVEFINKELRIAKDIGIVGPYSFNEEIQKFYSLSLNSDKKLLKKTYLPGEVVEDVIGTNIELIEFIVKEDEEGNAIENLLNLKVTSGKKEFKNTYNLDIYFENGEILVVPETIPNSINKVYYRKYED